MKLQLDKMKEQTRKRLLGMCIFILVTLATSSLLKISLVNSFYEINFWAILGMLQLVAAIYLFEEGFIKELRGLSNE